MSSQNISATKLLAKVCNQTIPLPDGFPEITIVKLEGEVNFSKADFLFSARGNFKWAPFGDQYQLDADATISVARKDGVNTIQIGVDSKNSITLAETLTLKSFDFQYTYHDGKWALGGNLSTVVLEKDFKLNVSLKLDNDKILQLVSQAQGEDVKQGLIKVEHFELSKINFNLVINLSSKSVDGGFTASTVIAGIAGGFKGEIKTGEDKGWAFSVSTAKEEEVSLNKLLGQFEKGLSLPLEGLDFIMTNLSLELNNNKTTIKGFAGAKYKLPGFDTEVILKLGGELSYEKDTKSVTGILGGEANFDDIKLGGTLDIESKKLSFELPSVS